MIFERRGVFYPFPEIHLAGGSSSAQVSVKNAQSRVKGASILKRLKKFFDKKSSFSNLILSIIRDRLVADATSLDKLELREDPGVERFPTIKTCYITY